ncbi:hypothetical protein Tco_1179570, partial [Tanacetum coccineum]
TAAAAVRLTTTAAVVAAVRPTTAAAGAAAAAWARAFAASQDQISQLYQHFVNNNMQLPVPDLLDPSQLINVVQDAPEDDDVPGDE